MAEPLKGPTTTLAPTWEQFRRIVADFLDAADTANADELEAGSKCVGLAFLGIQWEDGNKLHDVHRSAGAPALMRIVTRKVVEREIELERTETDEANTPRSVA